ncbi:MAG: Uma2 family endonuclease [Chloroflexi bacterium]|nr:Uma2 family endonuclease [Chloroflexota bacterium]
MAMPTTTRPSLDSGDRLTREEFHRRYCARPDIKKAELVEGVVYVASPVRVTHGRPHALVLAWLGFYQAKTPGVDFADNITVWPDAKNEVQPDACLWREEPGGPRVSQDGYLEGTPQLVVEVAASSASYDLHDKKEAYRRSGVREYVVWRVLDGAIDWFRLQGGEYVRLDPDARGVIESAVFPGLRLDIGKMLAGDLAAVLAELEPRPPG